MYMHEVYSRAAGAEENFGDFQLYNCDSAFNFDAISIKKIQKSKSKNPKFSSADL